MPVDVDGDGVFDANRIKGGERSSGPRGIDGISGGIERGAGGIGRAFMEDGFREGETDEITGGDGISGSFWSGEILRGRVIECIGEVSESIASEIFDARGTS